MPRERIALIMKFKLKRNSNLMLKNNITVSL